LHSPFPNSALALSPILGESLSTHMPFPSLDHFPSQLESKPFSHSSSKGPTLSLAQRRGGVSPSLCLPSLVHGASMTPRRNPELAPISTGNLTECNMLATVEIGNAYCELDAHNKVREKFPDAINNTAPQDGDEQVVPITRRPASFVQKPLSFMSGHRWRRLICSWRMIWNRMQLMSW
jgi:hypothetical protein